MPCVVVRPFADAVAGEDGGLLERKARNADAAWDW